MAQLALTGRRSGLMDSPTVMDGFEEALAIMQRVGEPSEVADTMIRISSQAAAMGDSKRSADVLGEAVRILEQGPPGPVLARAYAYEAEKEMFSGHVANALEFADRALTMATGMGPRRRRHHGAAHPRRLAVLVGRPPRTGRPAGGARPVARRWAAARTW